MTRPLRPVHPIGWILIGVWLLCSPKLGWAKEIPYWVEHGGSSQIFQSNRYLTGLGLAEGKEDALESAKQQATADLARQISVQIESNIVDVTTESNGRLENNLTSQIRATSDMRIDGIRFETHRQRKKVWALAILERLPAAVARRKQRDQALALTKHCLDDAAEEALAGRANQALLAYRSCRTPLEAALEHEAIAAALQRTSRAEDDVSSLLAEHATRISNRVRAIPHENASSIRSAAERSRSRSKWSRSRRCGSTLARSSVQN